MPRSIYRALFTFPHDRIHLEGMHHPWRVRENPAPGNHQRNDYDVLIGFRESYVYDPRPEAKTGAGALEKAFADAFLRRH